MTWESTTLKDSHKEDLIDSKNEKSYIKQEFDILTNESKSVVDIEILKNISTTISKELKIYKHCDYQASIAAAIASYNDPFIIAISPTGSGKTWI